MRDIKFRCWDTGINYMYYDPECYNIYNEEDNGLHSGYEDKYGTWHQNKLMQYTGLLDKQGVEVYEGDIVIEKSYPFYGNALVIEQSNKKLDELNYVGVVVWDNGYYIDLRAISDRVKGNAMGHNLYDYKELEVIGNIYEHSYLLGENK